MNTHVPHHITDSHLQPLQNDDLFPDEVIVPVVARRHAAGLLPPLHVQLPSAVCLYHITDPRLPAPLQVGVGLTLEAFEAAVEKGAEGRDAVEELIANEIGHALNDLAFKSATVPGGLRAPDPAVEEAWLDEHVTQFFAFEHLQTPAMRECSRMFYSVARLVMMTLPRNQERTKALNKILEAKDCAVRAMMAKTPAERKAAKQ